MITYTPSGGYNTGAQPLINLQKTLSSITGVPQSPISDAYNTAQGNYTSMAGGQSQYQQNVGQQNYNQSSIPRLIGQYGNLSQLFDLYLHDSNMAKKYSTTGGGGTGNLSPYQNPALIAASLTGGQNLQSGNQADMQKVSQMTTSAQPGATISGPNQVSGTVGETPNPYLGSSQDVLNSVADSPQAPSLTTAETAQPLNAASNLMDLVNQLIGTQQGVVQGVTAKDMAAYTDKMNTLQAVTQMLGGALNTQMSNKSNAANMPGTTEQAGNIFSQIIDQVQSEKGGKATEYDIWNYINQHDAALRAQGVNVDELWKLHSDLAKKVGSGGEISGGTKTPKSTTTALKPKIDSKGNLLGYTTPDGKFHAVQESGGVFGIGSQKVLKVKKISTGQTGTIPVNEFDPTQYTLI